MDTVAHLKNLQTSTKANIMALVFLIIELSYLQRYEAQSTYFLLYLGLIVGAWSLSFSACIASACIAYSEIVEEPQGESETQRASEL